jgi:hypothetical protein
MMPHTDSVVYGNLQVILVGAHLNFLQSQSDEPTVAVAFNHGPLSN